MRKKNLTYKRRTNEAWERVVSGAISNGISLGGFYPTDEELWINIDGDSYDTIVIKSDGTWRRE